MPLKSRKMISIQNAVNFEPLSRILPGSSEKITKIDKCPGNHGLI